MSQRSNASSSTLRIQTPRVFVPLLKECRYKAAHGGRGSGKSHFFAEMLVEKCLVQETRAVCIREVQKSLEESVKRLIEDKISALGLGHYFSVKDSWIDTPHGGLIIFQGMQNHTAESIKSLEGYDVAWAEEAQSLSKHSLRLLRPTIRKPGSQLWFTWNPRHETDPVDQLLRGEKKLPESAATVVEANYSDNPWFPPELEEERQMDLARDPDSYDHIWMGGYERISEAMIFRNRVSIETFETPSEGARFFLGADWGFANDPTALIRSFIRDDCLYIDHEAFGQGVELDDLWKLFAAREGASAEQSKQWRSGDERKYTGVPGARHWPIKADAARPETISYMRRQGFQIEAAEKWPGSVEDGIAHLKGFRKIVVHPRCKNIAQEFRLYSYKVDKQTGDVLPIIVDKHNHGIDAVRYSLDGYIQRRGGLGVWAKLAS